MYNRGQGYGLDTTIPLPKSYDVLDKQSSLYCGGEGGTGHIMHSSSSLFLKLIVYP